MTFCPWTPEHTGDAGDLVTVGSPALGVFSVRLTWGGEGRPICLSTVPLGADTEHYFTEGVGGMGCLRGLLGTHGRPSFPSTEQDSDWLMFRTC